MAKEDLKKTVISRDDLQQALVDNFIGIQKVMANLTVKFDELSQNMSSLLKLFEISAKTFAEKYSGKEPAPANLVDEEFIKKIDVLLEQNKIISKGIMLIEEKLRDKTEYEQAQEAPANYPPMQQPYPMMQQPYPQMQGQPYPQMMPPSMQPQQMQGQPYPPQLPSQSPYKREIGARQDASPKPLPKY